MKLFMGISLIILAAGYFITFNIIKEKFKDYITKDTLQAKGAFVLTALIVIYGILLIVEALV